MPYGKATEKRHEIAKAIDFYFYIKYNSNEEAYAIKMKREDLDDA